MFIVVFASLVATALAQPPVWWGGGQCGQSQYADAGDMVLPPGTKIVGGQEARPHEFPWTVSVRRRSTDSHFCGGSIINDFWVVTAAHCMDGESPAQVSIVAGEHDSNAISGVRESHDVEAIFVHESYSSIRLVNDVSVVKVQVAFDFSTLDIQPVCAPDPSNLYTYQKSHCAGWGSLSSGGVCCPAVLRYVTLNITTNAYCDDVYTTDQITDDMICATDNTGSNDRDSCQGDSGGPLTVKDGSNIFSLVGVVSWGIGCASGWPGVYARVGYQAAWITDKINNN